MDREDIIRMAREAGAIPIHKRPKEFALAGNEIIERFASLVAAAKETELNDGLTIAYMHGYEKGKDAGAAAEREAIMDEWWMCVQSDLENGVKSLNERAAGKLHKEYPAISGFDAAIRARGQA